ncbi:cation diffusion facilitator family transporter [Desulfurobacterium thermolithotrophum DSM 11699]|uniref:Cation diffusion facilitator family transporter n=1 Tax=Desulfurobacterium thermolithotrophum (strain DSM 11699 / BSA) TaxID=868864 RepID=F0S0Z2_DESTD|nr:cation diffusion facilitator family transporter [Desulfurobacterium thermolithotrophum]ADY72796.1 cation diffusion facilitator family transporter [Desulfurobacterium thermolithotrophum DSM 11699]
MVEEKKKIALYSVFLNLFLSLLKIIAGIISGSAALVADGVHSVADFAAALSVYAGIVIANKKVNGFPYGLYKVENVISLVSAFAIFFAGYEIARDVLFSQSKMEIENLPVAIGAIITTITLTYLFSKYERKKGEELNSPSLIADSEHIKTDMLSSIIVLTGILGNYFGYPIIEKIAVLIVVLFIFHSGFEIMLESLKVILDASIDRETLEKIKKIMLSYPLISRVKSVTGRSSGSYKFIEAEVCVSTDSLEKAHSLIHEIEERIKRDIPFIEKIIIHFEPEEKKKLIYAIPIEENEERVCGRFGECPKILLLEKEKNELKKLAIFRNPASNMQFGKCIELVEFLISKGVNCIAVNSLPLGKGVIFALSNYGVGMKLIPEEDLSVFIEKLKQEPTCEPPLAIWNRFVCDISNGGSSEGTRANR